MNFQNKPKSRRELLWLRKTFFSEICKGINNVLVNICNAQHEVININILQVCINEMTRGA